ncbi:hypothetical protein Dimus_022320 [Dionaea muscipula]
MVVGDGRWWWRREAGDGCPAGGSSVCVWEVGVSREDGGKRWFKMATVGDGEVERRIASGELLLGGGRCRWHCLVVVLLAWRWTSRAARSGVGRYTTDEGNGLRFLRFSLSWTRILPQGRLSGGINKLGIQFYNNLINELLANDIQPLVTIFHWDAPQALVDEEDFHDYANVCFREFGDTVKYWVTINEPNIFREFGYAIGKDAPGLCSKYINNCTFENSATKPYQVTHHQILAHASAVRLYKQRYQAFQKGIIGVSIDSNWYIPLSQMSADIKVASRAFDFNNKWILDPITFGDYPESMRSIVGSILSVFTKNQSQLIKGSYDFVGINYYTSNYISDDPSSSSTDLSYTTDNRVISTEEKDGVPIGEPVIICTLLSHFSYA